MIRLLFSFFLTAPFAVICAQHPIDQAVSLIEKEKYNEALPLLDEGLHSAAIDPALQAKGYFYRATCHLNMENAQDNYLLKAVYDLAKVRNGQSDWREKAKDLIKSLHPSLTDSANHYYNLISVPETSDAGKGRMATKARKYFDALVILTPSDYSAYHYRGSCSEIMADPINSARDFDQCIQFYKGNLPTTPDPLIGKSYFQAASVNHKYLQKTKKALSLISAGKEFTETEKIRCLDIKKQVTEEQWNNLMADFDSQLKSLAEFELAISESQEQIIEPQIKAFEQVLAGDPNNASLWMAFGDLYLPIDAEKAEACYLKALEINLNNPDLLDRLIHVSEQLGKTEKQAEYQESRDQLKD